MSARWDDIAALFDEALNRPPDERREWLRAACDDASLRESVERLLDAHERNSGILDRPFPSEAAPPVGPSLERERLGPYRLLHEIGRGGMGTVYLAERDDDQFQRRVAVKVLRAAVADEAASRFHAERQILATLDHPNIAALYDGGVTRGGRPYFVMEHVEGTPINTYCDSHRLSIEERLELFRPVARAVQAAHQNLVVHRDLKPSNILVTEEETVKLLDFGIAKLLDPAATGLTQAPRTRTGHPPMTPAYASPEQVTDATITTSSDVYQLGLVLYELLAGRRPYDVEGRTPSEVERVVCEQEPTRPSTAITSSGGETPPENDAPSISARRRTSPDALQKTLRGDLDAIVLMALRKEPERRYASAREMAEDLDRFLENRPVHARPDTWSYRVRSFTRRHRVGVTATLLVLLSLVMGLIGTAWQARRASQQATVAARERDKAEQVTTFLMDLFEATDPGEALGDTVTARQLLTRGVERAEALTDQPAVQAQMFDVVGQVYRRLGRYEEARPLLKRGLSIRRDLYGPRDPAVATSMVHLGHALGKMARLDDAEPLLRDALALRRDLFGPEHPDVAAALSSLGAVLMEKGTYDEAESMLREALSIQRQVHGDRHLDVAETLNILGLLLDDMGRRADAEPMLREALSIRESLLDDRDPRVAMSLNNLALLLRKMGDYEAAEPVYRKALSVKRDIYGEEHPSLAATLNGLGLLLQSKGELKAAQSHLREALRIRRSVWGPEHPSVGVSLNNVGNLLEDRGRLDEAVSHMQEARALFRTALGDAHPYVAFAALGIARVLMKQEEPTDAEPLIREALSIRKRVLPAGHWQIAEAKGFLGHCLTQQEHFAAAEPHLLQAYRTIRAARGPEHAATKQTLQYLVDLYEGWDRESEAAAYRDSLAGVS